MPKMYQVKKNRLPLPLGPLSEGHPERNITISALPDEYSSEADAFGRARTLVQEGYGISIKAPDGRDWSHEEILHRLNSEAA